MSARNQPHDDMWRTPPPASSKAADEDPDQATSDRVAEEHAVEDSWYQVLRRKHLEDAQED